MIDEQGVVEGVRVVIVQLAALLKGQLVVALVVAVVGDEAHFVLPEKRLEPTGQSGLAAAGAACDADDEIVHVPKTSACRLWWKKSPKWGIISLPYIITHFALF